MATGIRKTTEEFVSESKCKHGNKYDYSLVHYVNKKTKVKIICDIHGIFEQQPDNHLMGQGCRLCGINRKASNIDIFIKNANKIHNNKYDYSLSKYLTNQTSLIITCPIHGNFTKTPNAHLCGAGCSKCAYISRGHDRTKTHEEFLIDAINLHGDLYVYLDKYVKSYQKIKMLCTKCNRIFTQKPKSHLEGKGCSSCKHSRGELNIRKFLVDNQIDFITEYTFEDCKNIQVLPFDFYIIDLNMCIEYDGLQHYKPIEFFGGMKTLIEIQKRDKIKTDYCNHNNINLVRIRYDEDILEKLKTILN